MASKGERRYGKPPKIGRKESGGDSDVTGDEDKSEHEEEASSKAKKTAGKPKAEAAMDTDKGPEPKEAAGDDHIPVHARHAMERAELNHSHAMEHGTMNARHEMEHMSHDMGKGDA